MIILQQQQRKEEINPWMLYSIIQTKHKNNFHSHDHTHTHKQNAENQNRIK